MLSFLFWNVAKKPLQHRVARMAFRFDADFVMLAESPVPAAETLAALNAAALTPYNLPSSLAVRIQLFTRLPLGIVTDEFNSPRMTIRHVHPASSPRFLLAAAHFPSKLSWNNDDQTLWTTEAAASIRGVEENVGHQRTLLIGDLNMNPFDAGVVGAQGLHAVMSRDLARRGERDVAGKAYPFFYNPMWGCFGDRTAGPAGTFFLSSAKPANYFWNMYDQVLVRRDLMAGLRQVAILDSDGEEPLVTPRGRPKKTTASDHLPILVRLDI